MNTPTSLILLDSEPGEFAYYAWHNIMIACWSKQATGAAVERITRVREALGRKHPEGVSVVYLIGSEAGLPTSEARAGARDLMARFQRQRACLAIVVKGEGFGASAMRAAIAGARLLVGGQFEMRVCSGVEEVVDWLPPLHESATSTRIAPAQLEAVLQELVAGL